MRSGLIVALGLLLAFACPSAGASDAHANRILVTFADPGLSNASRAGPARPGYARRAATYLVAINVRRAADRLARDFGLEFVDEWPIVPLNVHCLVYSVPDSGAVDGLLAQLRARPEVESAQRMNAFEVLGSTPDGAGGGPDPYSGLQHNLETLELVAAHNWSRGAGSNVTIIDTGADFHHPELVSQVQEHVNFVSGDKRDFVSDAHGTAVAGIIGAAAGNGVGMVGVAPSAKLSLLKACWYPEGGGAAVCDSFTLAKALSHVVEAPSQVVNLSLGGPADPLLARLLSLAIDRGLVVVAAEPPTMTPGFPSDVPGVIVVGSDAGRNPGSALLLAPGDEILVPTPGGGYDYASGNSLSAAQVSGIAALLLARRPKLTGAEVRELLSETRGVASVNACRALAHLLQRAGCRDDDRRTALARDSEAGGEADDKL